MDTHTRNVQRGIERASEAEDYGRNALSDLRLNDVLLANLSSELSASAFDHHENLRERRSVLGDSLKFVSEALIAVHFSDLRGADATRVLVAIRDILLHDDSVRIMRVNPHRLTWILNATALLSQHFEMEPIRRFVIEMCRQHTLDIPDASHFRVEENRYLYALLTGSRYQPTVSEAFDSSFHHLSSEQAYALTHLLFYRSDYGSARTSVRTSTMFAIEHLAIEAYENGNLDLLLELMLNYQALNGTNQSVLEALEGLAADLINQRADLQDALCRVGSASFFAWYHQVMLCCLYRNGIGSRQRVRCEGIAQNDTSALRDLLQFHEFHSALLSGDFVTPARLFCQLPESDGRLGFARRNLDNYLALQSHDFCRPTAAHDEVQNPNGAV